MQAEAFQSACSCSPGSQVGAGSEHSCPGQPTLSQLHLHLLLEKEHFRPRLLRINISHREQGEGERGRREWGRWEDQKTPPVLQDWLQNNQIRPILLQRYSRCLRGVFYLAELSPSYDQAPAHLRPGRPPRAPHHFHNKGTDPARRRSNPWAPRRHVWPRGNNSILRFTGDFPPSRGFSNADSFTNNFLPFKNKAYLIPQNTPIALDYHSH